MTRGLALTAALLALGLGVPASATVRPSADCDGGSQIVDVVAEDVHAKVYEQFMSTTELHLCARFEPVDGGPGVGGEFVVAQGQPSVVPGNFPGQYADTNSAACTTTTPNDVPGQHPISGGSVAGVPYVLDAYSSGPWVWVCIGLSNVVSYRQRVWHGTPFVHVTPGTDVEFRQDPS